MNTAASASASDLIRQHAVDAYLTAARRNRDKTFSINAGDVHKALKLNNLVPSVCNALTSKKFLAENHLRLVSWTGPQSGKSTTVTYTYEFIDQGKDSKTLDRQDAWNRLQGALKDVFAAYGGGEAYLRTERASFRDADERK